MNRRVFASLTVTWLALLTAYLGPETYERHYRATTPTWVTIEDGMKMLEHLGRICPQLFFTSLLVAGLGLLAAFANQDRWSEVFDRRRSFILCGYCLTFATLDLLLQRLEVEFRWSELAVAAWLGTTLIALLFAMYASIMAWAVLGRSHYLIRITAVVWCALALRPLQGVIEVLGRTPLVVVDANGWWNIMCSLVRLSPNDTHCQTMLGSMLGAAIVRWRLGPCVNSVSCEDRRPWQFPLHRLLSVVTLAAIMLSLMAANNAPSTPPWLRGIANQKTLLGVAILVANLLVATLSPRFRLGVLLAAILLAVPLGICCCFVGSVDGQLGLDLGAWLEFALFTAISLLVVRGLGFRIRRPSHELQVG